MFEQGLLRGHPLRIPEVAPRSLGIAPPLLEKLLEGSSNPILSRTYLHYPPRHRLIRPRSGRRGPKIRTYHFAFVSSFVENVLVSDCGTINKRIF